MVEKISLSKDTRAIRKLPYLVRWWGEFDPTIGKQRRYSKSFAKRKDAEFYIEQLKNDFDAGMPRDEFDITLKQLCDKFISTRKNLSKSTLDGYANTIDILLKHFCPTISVKKIRQEDAEEFIAGITLINEVHIKKGKEISDSTRSRHLRQCKKLFQTAADWGYLRKNPFAPIKTRKIRNQVWHYFSPSEFQGILDKTPDLMTKAFYSVMYFCGLRFGEAINLLWDGINIDFEHNKINIVNRPATKDLPPFNVKDFEERSVPMPKHVVDIITKLQQESETGNPFVFLTKARFHEVQKDWAELCGEGKAGDWLNRDLVNNVLRNFKKRCSDAGIKHTGKHNVHCLRKSYATNLANAGTPVQTLMKLMGHSSISTTQKYYLHSSDANEQRAVEALERLTVAPSE